MYFGRLHKKKPENCSINVLKKRFLCPFRVLQFYTTVRNYRIFLFSRTLPKTCVRKHLCTLVDYTRKRLKIAVSMSSKNDLWVLEFFTTVRSDRIFLFPRTLPGTCVSINICILVDYTTKNPKIAVLMSLKKEFWDRFRFLNFFRLFETIGFFFFLGLFQRLASAQTYVF